MVTIPRVAAMMVAVIEVDPIDVGLETENDISTLQILPSLHASRERIFIVVEARFV